MDGHSIYVASPLGFTEPGRRYLVDILHPALAGAGLRILDPWDDPSDVVAATIAIPVDDPTRLGALRAMNQILGRRNASSIASADAMLAVVDGSDVDSGTAAEIGYAAGIGIPVVGLRTDVRTAGDNEGTSINLQVRYFVEATGGSLHRTLDDAIRDVARVADERVLFHLARTRAWAEALRTGAYTASTRDESLADVGFIHLSFRRQLAATARRHYGDLDPSELVLLTVDRRKLSSRLIVEPASSVGDVFPHVYGPLNLDAVVATSAVARTADGALVPV